MGGGGLPLGRWGWWQGADRSAGAAYLILGGGSLPSSGTLSYAATATLTGASTTDYAGSAVAGVGDTDLDGWDDLLIGARGVGSSDGGAYLVLGPVSGTVSLSTADAFFEAAGSYDYAGSAVAGAGDVDGNGRPDLLIGAMMRRRRMRGRCIFS